jgi:hypothetical protein
MSREHDCTPQTLEERVDRIDSLEQIRQLPHRYALAIDSRNMDDLVELFVEDVRVGRNEVGRGALGRWFSDTLGRIGTSIHFVGNHVIDFEDADHASGVVYCRDEIERPDGWDVGYIQYWDRYERRGGLWYFVRRKLFRWFMVDALTRPSQGAGVGSGDEALTTGLLPDAWPSWNQFWARRPGRGS